MSSRRSKVVAVAATVVLWSLLLSLLACGQAPQGSATRRSDTQPTSEAISGKSTGDSAKSAADVWAASVAAVECLGPVRVKIVQKLEGYPSDGQTWPGLSGSGLQVTDAEELLDISGKRALDGARGRRTSEDSRGQRTRETYCG